MGDSSSFMRELYDFITDLGGMRDLYRFSEVDVIKTDSVGAHTYRLALLVQACKGLVPDIDVAHAMKLALYHDIADQHIVFAEQEFFQRQDTGQFL